MKRLLLIICFALISNSAFAIEESAKSPILLNLESEKASDNLDNYQFLPEEIIDEYPIYQDSVEPEQGNDIPMQPLTDKSFNASSHAVDGTSFNPKALFFDPKADFRLNAQKDNRDMLPMEKFQYDLHKALFADVKPTSLLSPKPLLHKYLSHEFEKGPFKEVHAMTAYRGSFVHLWDQREFVNSYYDKSSCYSIFEGTLKNEKTIIRSMWFWAWTAPGYGFFNRAVGDQYIMHKITKNDQIVIGYSQNPSGIEGSTPSIFLPFYNMSQLARNYGYVRALGVRVQGKHKYVNYSIGGLSSGRLFYDWFPGFEFVGDLGVKPLSKWDGKYGNLIVGGTLNTGRAANQYTVINAYADYEYKRLNVTLEYGVANGSNGASGITANKSEGYNATIGYRITPKLQALFRYDVFDSDKDRSNDISTETTVGFNYFIKEQALRLMLNYTMYNIQNRTYGSRLYSGIQVIL